MKSRHVGMGLVLFQNVFDIDDKDLYNYINWLEDDEEDTFTYHSSDTEDFAKNKAGFKFRKEDVQVAPQRLHDLTGFINGRDIPQEYLIVFNKLKEASYNILIEYCRYFSECQTTAWWLALPHIARYTEGQGIGLHCDNQIPFEWGKPTMNQVSLHNTCSINIYLNDCEDDGVSNTEITYTGGHIIYPNADFEWIPKKASAVVYPSNYIGRHEVSRVTSGTRYAYLVNVCQGTSFDNQEKVGQENMMKTWLPNLSKDIVNSGQNYLL